MLNNPDVTPSASINRWIVSILMFHFKLRHVPGKHHGPDGLSRRPPQPGDISDDDHLDDFDDWVDNLYGFIHLVNPSPPAPESDRFIQMFTSEQTSCRPLNTRDSDWNDPPFKYHKLPRSATAVAADKRLMMAHDWLVTFE